VMAWLDGHGDILDVGGGTGFAGRYATKSAYSVLDGSRSIVNEAEVDLVYAHFTVDCVLLRHVLEHNANWQAILLNVLEGFQKRAAIVTFLRLTPATTFSHNETGFIGYVGTPVPVFYLGESELLSLLAPYLVRRELVEGAYHEEIFYLEKPDVRGLASQPV
jgi:hypothetical protein